MKKFKKGGEGIGLSKHRAGGKNNRNPTNNLQIVRELEQEQKRKKELQEKKKGKMFSSVSEVFR